MLVLSDKGRMKREVDGRESSDTLDLVANTQTLLRDFKGSVTGHKRIQEGPVLMLK